MCPPVAVVDWQDAATYAALAGCDRHGFAWEWLRRRPEYQAVVMATAREDRAAQRFGLHVLEPFQHGVPSARPIWRAEADPYVLIASAISDDRGGALDPMGFGALAACHVDPVGREYWLLSDGWHGIRVDIVGGTLRAGPAILHYHIAGLDRAMKPLATLRRLIALAGSGSLPSSLFRNERKAMRWAMVLRVHDALVAGASQRQIADSLFDIGDLPRWRVNAPSWRRRVQRLVEAARRCAQTDPRRWIDERFP